MLMFVYIDTASAVNSRAFGGITRVAKQSFNVLLLEMYDGCALATGWSLRSTQTPRAYSRLPEHDTIGRVFHGVLCFFMVI